jgi:glutamate N-acetyltransferase/amino-acid N-acetyltransferase
VIVSTALPGGFRVDTETGLTLLVNDGPTDTAAGLFGAAELAAPALWSRQALTDGRLRAVALVPPAAGSGPEQFQAVHATAERVGARLAIGAVEVAVCWADALGDLGGHRTAPDGWTIAVFAAPALAVLVTDAVVDPAVLDSGLSRAWPATGGATVLLLASGASGRTPSAADLAAELTALREELA